jgi:hypothetical protein
VANHRARVLLSLCVALLVLALAGQVAARPQAVDKLLQISVALEGLPALTAPGGTVPLHWSVEGGETVERAAVFWDTMTHAYDNAYPYRTEMQPYRDSRNFYDYVDVPQDAETVYLRPYVVVDGEAVWGPEKTVSIWRGVHVGSPSTYGDGLGRVWAEDLDYAHNWYGLIGGEAWQTAQAIAGTDEDGLYQRQRMGLSGFGCWLSEAAVSMEIEVELHLAEFLASSAGERVFDIVLEPDTPDEVVVSGVDVFAEVGAFSALVITRMVSVHDQQLDIAFVPIVGEPILNAIAVRGVSAVPQRSTDQRIAYPEHDTYVLSTGNYREAETVRIGGEDRYHGGLRFFELQVPQGAKINHAELWVTSVMTYYQQIDLTLYGEAADRAPSHGARGPVGDHRVLARRAGIHLPRIGRDHSGDRRPTRLARAQRAHADADRGRAGARRPAPARVLGRRWLVRRSGGVVHRLYAAGPASADPGAHSDAHADPIVHPDALTHAHGDRHAHAIRVPPALDPEAVHQRRVSAGRYRADRDRQISDRGWNQTDRFLCANRLESVQTRGLLSAIMGTESDA